MSLAAFYGLSDDYHLPVLSLTFDEDRSQVRCGNIPQVMAAIRNMVIGLMRWLGYTNIAATCRYFAAQPWDALEAIGIQI